MAIDSKLPPLLPAVVLPAAPSIELQPKLEGAAHVDASIAQLNADAKAQRNALELDNRTAMAGVLAGIGVKEGLALLSTLIVSKKLGDVALDAYKKREQAPSASTKSVRRDAPKPLVPNQQSVEAKAPASHVVQASVVVLPGSDEVIDFGEGADVRVTEDSISVTRESGQDTEVYVGRPNWDNVDADGIVWTKPDFGEALKDPDVANADRQRVERILKGTRNLRDPVRPVTLQFSSVTELPELPGFRIQPDAGQPTSNVNVSPVFDSALPGFGTLPKTLGDFQLVTPLQEPRPQILTMADDKTKGAPPAVIGENVEEVTRWNSGEFGDDFDIERVYKQPRAAAEESEKIGASEAHLVFAAPGTSRRGHAIDINALDPHVAPDVELARIQDFLAGPAAEARRNGRAPHVEAIRVHPQVLESVIGPINVAHLEKRGGPRKEENTALIQVVERSPLAHAAKALGFPHVSIMPRAEGSNQSLITFSRRPMKYK